MFDNNSNNQGEETSFAEAYKSQILNPSEEEEESSSLPKIIGIALLMLLISGISIYGYKYINSNKVEEKAVEIEEESALPQSPMMIDNIEDLKSELPEADTPPVEVKVEKPTSTSKPKTIATEESVESIADKVKIELSKEIDKESGHTTTKASTEPEKSPSTQKGEDTYLEQLAELSKEIDGVAN